MKASRMTKAILPEEFYNELKPSLIAPVVVYLCHENTEDNGNIIESACGWATKVHFIRGKGSLLRTSITEGVTPEFVRDRWDAVTDMSEATHLNSIGEASASFMGILEELKSSSTAQKSTFQDSFTYSSRDLILYSLGIGVSTDDEDNLKFLYENHPDFAAFPTFSVIPGLVLSMTSGLVSSVLKNFDLSQVRKLKKQSRR
jgi:(3R)-3-hydroxyacyl-CoA dehydrogenase / 3a,7a,12a-trihydroxy-5b-cholest-24-enoyl-CoA hydratase / enoyl-CoA hydratase 2